MQGAGEGTLEVSSLGSTAQALLYAVELSPSATARLFQPQAAPLSALVDDTPRDYPAQNGLARGSPNQGSTTGLPVRGTTPNHRYTSDEEGVSSDTATSEKSFHKRRGSRRN